MSTVPANQIVNSIPSVLPAGGAAIDINGLVLTASIRVPIGTVQEFDSPAAINAFFGPTSKQASFAAVYFAGFNGSSSLPGALFYTQYPANPVAAWIRGGNISAVPLATLQSYSGTLNVTIDGSVKTASINLSAATSFSNAAEIIGQGLGIEGVQAATLTASIGGTFTATSTGTVLTVSAVLTGSLQAGDSVSGTDGTNSLPGGCTIASQLTGSPGGIGTYQLSAAATPGNLSSCTVTSSSTILDVTAVATGSLSVADVVSGGSVPANTYITSQITGTPGGVGTYGLSGTGHTVASEAMTAFTPAVQYDSITGAFLIFSGTTGVNSTVSFGSGALATNLLLTQALGAVQSPGAAAAVPAAFMDGVVAANADWVTFTTDFNPDAGSANTVKQAFAAWNTGQDDDYAYVCWDTDPNPAAQLPANSSLGQILRSNANSGTSLNWEPGDQNLAAFVMGAAASIDFEEVNGRITFAGRMQSGLVAGVTTGIAATNLAGNPQVASSFGNGYNFYGAYGQATAPFIWYQRGTVTGPFGFLDSYINQIWLRSLFQDALLLLIQNTKSIPTNAAGYSTVANALSDSIQQGLSFGAYGPGTLTGAQATAVNTAAGAAVANTIATQGWYLQVVPASGAVKGSRGPLLVKFWYLDNGSVQSFTMDTIAVVG